MKQTKVGTRLALGFALFLLMLVAVIGFGVKQLASLNEGTRSITAEAYPKVVLAQNLADRINRTARTVRDLLLLSEPEADKKNFAAIAAARKETEEMFAELAAAAHSEEGVRRRHRPAARTRAQTPERRLHRLQ